MEIEKQSSKSSRGGKRPGAGRPKGSLDKGNALIREMVAESLTGLGGVAYLKKVAKSHPPAFLALLGRVIPVQVVGEGDGPLKVEFTWSK